MSPARFAFVAAAVTIGAAAVISVVGIHNGDPRCPIDGVVIPESGLTKCYQAVNPADAPSRIDVVPVSVDRKTSERGLVLAVGGLGAFFLLALGLRLAARDRIGARTPFADPG